MSQKPKVEEFVPKKTIIAEFVLQWVETTDKVEGNESRQLDVVAKHVNLEMLPLSDIQQVLLQNCISICQAMWQQTLGLANEMHAMQIMQGQAQAEAEAKKSRIITPEPGFKLS